MSYDSLFFFANNGVMKWPQKYTIRMPNPQAYIEKKGFINVKYSKTLKINLVYWLFFFFELHKTCYKSFRTKST